MYAYEVHYQKILLRKSYCFALFITNIKYHFQKCDTEITKEESVKDIECIAKWCLISQYVTTTLSKAVKQDDRSLV